jgi:hypothetical protein
MNWLESEGNRLLLTPRYPSENTPGLLYEHPLPFIISANEVPSLENPPEVLLTTKSLQLKTLFAMTDLNSIPAATAAPAPVAAPAVAPARAVVPNTELPDWALSVGGSVKMLVDVPALDAQDVEVATHMTEKVKGMGTTEKSNVKWAGYRIKFLEEGLVTYVSGDACVRMGLLVKTENGVSFAYSRLSAVRAQGDKEATLVGA